MSALLEPPVRAEYELPQPPPQPRSEPAQQASAPRRRVFDAGWLRKGLLLIVLAGLWEAVARWQNNDLLLPGFVATAKAFYQGVVSGELLGYVGVSLWVLVQGYAAGILGAFLLTSLAVSTRFGRDLLETLTAMFNPLPAIALLPLALLWFGLGNGSLIFVLTR